MVLKILKLHIISKYNLQFYNTVKFENNYSKYLIYSTF